jgi:hypothetical protein
VDNLRHLNTQVAKSGFVEVHAGPQFAAISPRMNGFGFGGERGDAISAGASHGGGPSGGGHAAAGGAGHR